MKKNNYRDEQLKMLEEAEAYFDKLGLTSSFESFFSGYTVKNVLHEVYEVFKADAKKIVLNLPGPAQKRGNKLLDNIAQYESDYMEDAKNSFLYTVADWIQTVNSLVFVEDVIADKLHHAFDDYHNEKLLRVVHEFANGLTKIMLEKFEYAVSIPSGIPDEVTQVLSAISGGNPVVSLAEIEAYRAEKPSDDGADV